MDALVFAGADEVFHLHLLELARAEDEVAGRDLVAERLTDLRDAEGNLASHRRLHVQEVDEDALRRFGPKIGERCRVVFIGDCADGRAEHEVEGARLRPILPSAIRTRNMPVVECSPSFY